MKHYYLYQITNNLNGKIYVGVHQTTDLNDGYMGSGKVIRSAINKHEIENFTKVILEHFDTSEAMYAREKEVVTEEFLLREDVYNLRRGGFGGFEFINRNAMNVYGSNGKSGFGGENLINGTTRIHSLEENKQISETLKKKYTDGFENPFKGYSHTDETKKIISMKNSKRQLGGGNSQFGTCWVSHELIGSKKISKELLPDYIEQGWVKGRFKVGERHSWRDVSDCKSDAAG